MNKENFYRVADAIEQANRGEPILFDESGEPMVFDMTRWHGNADCGTPACVGGFAECLSGSAVGRDEDAARVFLGLNNFEAHKLFFVPDGGLYYAAINNRSQHVPAALRWMADHEIVSWRKAFEALGVPLDD